MADGIKISSDKKSQEPGQKRIRLRQLKEMVGQEFNVSDYLTMTQERIKAFASCTEDYQWIHVDVDKAAKSPVKSTIAHGFLLLSLLPYFLSQSPLANIKAKMLFNYGLDRIRFISPVKPGDRIRNRAVLSDIRRKGFRRWLVKIDNTLEIEGSSRPALFAELLIYIFF